MPPHPNPAEPVAQTQSQPQNCKSCICKNEGLDLEKKLNEILKKTVTKLLVGLTEVLIEFSKPQVLGNTLDEKAKYSIIVKKIGETLDRALASDNEDPEAQGNSEDEGVEESGATAITQTKSPKPSVSRYTPANERWIKKKRKKRGNQSRWR